MIVNILMMIVLLEKLKHCGEHDKYDKECVKCIVAPVPDSRHYYIACRILQSVRKSKSEQDYFKHLFIMVGRFHADAKHNKKGATNALTKLCLEYCDIVKMKENDLEKVKRKHSELIDVLDNNKNMGNSQISEQTMNVVGRFAYIVNRMDVQKQEFVLLSCLFELS
eukprot:536070_1